MSMNTFVIEQKHGQVNFHGDLQHTRSRNTNDIYSPICCEGCNPQPSPRELIDFRETFIYPDCQLRGHDDEEVSQKGLPIRVLMQWQILIFTHDNLNLRWYLSSSTARYETSLNWNGPYQRHPIYFKHRLETFLTSLCQHSPRRSTSKNGTNSLVVSALTIYDRHKLWQAAELR